MDDLDAPVRELFDAPKQSSRPSESSTAIPVWFPSTHARSRPTKHVRLLFPCAPYGVLVTVPNVLAARYASAEMVAIWSPEAKVVAERRLWLAVLRAQM